MESALDEQTRATRSAVQFCALEAGYSVAKINRLTETPGFRRPERRTVGVLRALTNMQEATEKAIRSTVVSAVRVGALTVPQAAAKAGVSDEVVRSWGVLPEWERYAAEVDPDWDSTAQPRVLPATG